MRTCVGDTLARVLLLVGLLLSIVSCSESDISSPEYVGSIYITEDDTKTGNSIALTEPAALSLSSSQAAFSVDDVVLVNKVRLDRTVFEYTFQLSLTHNGTGPVTGVSAQVSSANPSTSILDGQIDVGDLDAGETITTTDTFSFAHDRSVEFGDSNLTVSFSVAAPAAAVRFIGRYDDSDPDAVRSSWSGTGFVVRFEGTGASVTMRGDAALPGGLYYTVVVDGFVQPAPLVVSNLETTYVLASALPDGEHIIEVYRRPDALRGSVIISEVQVEGVPLPVPEPLRQIEVVGDSWSTGYGVEGPNGSCRYNVATENNFISWGAITARAVGAELSNVSVNGRGVIRNCCGNTDDPMLVAYDQVVLDDTGTIGTIRPADVVFVSLGANDLIGLELPIDFVFAYEFLLEKVRTFHPDALIAPIYARDDSFPGFETVLRSATEEAIALRVNAGDTNIQLADVELPNLIDFGCDFHPGPLTHIGMSEKALTFLNDQLGW